MMDVEIISLNEENIDEIVSVHLKSFPDSLLTRLGYECVQRYYRWQFNSDDDVHVYGAKLEDDIVGF